MNKKARMLALLAVFGIVLVTIGATYAVFTYSATGETLSTISVGSITFQYNEEQGKGRGIAITNAMPVESNENAKSSDDYFEFTINSTTTDGVRIPYTITARRSGDVEMGDIVNMYLTTVDGGETPTALFTGTLPKFNELTTDWNNNSIEKVIYTGQIPANYDGPAIRYRLRMWIDEDADMSGTVVTKYFCGDEEIAFNGTCENGVSPETRKIMTSPYNNMEFSVTVNVYSQGASGPYFSGVTVDGHQAQPAPDNSGLDQQVTIPASSTNGDIVSQVVGDESMDVDVTRMDDTFTNPVDPNATGYDFMESVKVKRIAASEASEPLNGYLATNGEWGDVFLKLDMKRRSTGKVVKSLKLKVTIEQPTVEISPIFIEAGNVVSDKQPMKKNATVVSDKAWDYELVIPKDSRYIKLDSTGITFSGHGLTSVEYQRYADETFTTTVGDVTTNATHGMGNEPNIDDSENLAKIYYYTITIKANNKGEYVTLATKKIKLIRSNSSENPSGTNFLSPTWYE